MSTAGGGRNAAAVRVLSIIGAGVLGAALFWETAATRAVAKRAREDLATAKLQSTTQCNRVALARSLNEYSAYQGAVQWRRAFIAAVTLVGLAPLVAGVTYGNPKQVLVLLLLTWVVVSSIAGFHDYHARSLADTAVQASLDLAMSQFDQATCDPAIVAPFARVPA